MAICVPISYQICQRLGLRGPLSGKVFQPALRPSNTPVRAINGLKEKFLSDRSSLVTWGRKISQPAMRPSISPTFLRKHSKDIKKTVLVIEVS